YPMRQALIIGANLCREILGGFTVRQFDELKLMEVFSLVDQLHADPSRRNLIRASERITARTVDGITACNRACEWQCRLRCDEPMCRSSPQQEGKHANNDASDQRCLLSGMLLDIRRTNTVNASFYSIESLNIL